MKWTSILQGASRSGGGTGSQQSERKVTRMQTTEIIVTVTIHKYERAEIGQARRWSGLRRWFAWLNPWTVAWYAFLTAAGGGLVQSRRGLCPAGAGLLRRRRRGAGPAPACAVLCVGGYHPGHHAGCEEPAVKRRKKPPKSPANATAWCALHERLMNDVYIRRRGCAMRMCKHLVWLKETGPPGGEKDAGTK